MGRLSGEVPDGAAGAVGSVAGGFAHRQAGAV
ncbi:hypothetical protein SAMN05444370_10561 [Rubrimonas cliftonensis]|uniref:Uncharacterized protein n=1 Tax=Rubrimonas cliftonensis TaxID=89524 RepID=A0A1H4B8F8_9RHOB|nr:hypothetical protein SAMN05444370_10561 [Rubrimonas cliftonensis]